MASTSARITETETRLSEVKAVIAKTETVGAYQAGTYSVTRANLPDLYRERDRLVAELNTLRQMQRRQAAGKGAGALGSRGVRFQ